ncbi:hypothetical protein GCM10023238_32300 [Streptomyces heliomycini]
MDSTTDTMSSAYDGDSGVQQLERGQRERGQRLVQREVLLQVHGEADDPALGVRPVELSTMPPSSRER